MRLDAEDCRRRLASAAHAVLAVNDAHGPPLAVPITFALVGKDVVVFAVDHKPKSVRRLRRLTLVAADPRVAVLADDYADDWRRLWWVRADGRAEVLAPGTAAQARAAGLAALVDKYPQYREREPDADLVLIRVERWSGWSASSRP